jgi:hypothetical protein
LKKPLKGKKVFCFFSSEKKILDIKKAYPRQRSMPGGWRRCVFGILFTGVGRLRGFGIQCFGCQILTGCGVMLQLAGDCAVHVRRPDSDGLRPAAPVLRQFRSLRFAVRMPGRGRCSQK